MTETPPPPTPAPSTDAAPAGQQTDLTFDEMVDTLTGYDEIAIQGVTGKALETLLRTNALHATRCAIAVHLMREAGGQGAKAFKTEYDKAMGLSIREVRTYFAKPADDVMPDEPDSESGKDDSHDAQPTTT
jgi:hypothetical protein